MFDCAIENLLSDVYYPIDDVIVFENDVSTKSSVKTFLTNVIKRFLEACAKIAKFVKDMFKNLREKTTRIQLKIQKKAEVPSSLLVAARKGAKYIMDADKAVKEVGDFYSEFVEDFQNGVVIRHSKMTDNSWSKEELDSFKDEISSAMDDKFNFVQNHDRKRVKTEVIPTAFITDLRGAINNLTKVSSTIDYLTNHMRTMLKGLDEIDNDDYDKNQKAGFTRKYTASIRASIATYSTRISTISGFLFASRSAIDALA